jgi:hypothetical protein
MIENLLVRAINATGHERQFALSAIGPTVAKASDHYALQQIKGRRKAAWTNES